METANLLKKKVTMFFTNEANYHRIKFYKILLDYKIGKKYDPIIHHLPELIKPKGTIIDIGANMGQWMMPLSKIFTQSVIISFEPVPINFKFLCKAIKILRLHNAQCYDFAFSDRTGTEKMLIPYINNIPVTTQSILKNSLKKKINEKFKEIEVKTMSIDDFVENYSINNLTFIKIDTEGAEDKVLRGGENTILKYKPVMVIETSIHNIEIQKLLKVGYNVYYLSKNTIIPYEIGKPHGDLILMYNIQL